MVTTRGYSRIALVQLGIGVAQGLSPVPGERCFGCWICHYLDLLHVAERLAQAAFSVFCLGTIVAFSFCATLFILILPTLVRMLFKGHLTVQWQPDPVTINQVYY